jgi:hypothetical protein
MKEVHWVINNDLKWDMHFLHRSLESPQVAASKDGREVEVEVQPEIGMTEKILYGMEMERQFAWMRL